MPSMSFNMNILISLTESPIVPRPELKPQRQTDRQTDSDRQDRTGQDRTGQDRTGQDRTGQDRTGQDRTGQDKQTDTQTTKQTNKQTNKLKTTHPSTDPPASTQTAKEALTICSTTSWPLRYAGDSMVLMPRDRKDRRGSRGVVCTLAPGTVSFYRTYFPFQWVTFQWEIREAVFWAKTMQYPGRAGGIWSPTRA